MKSKKGKARSKKGEVRSEEATVRHTRRLLAGIHPKALEDGFPIENVGNDGQREKGKVRSE